MQDIKNPLQQFQEENKEVLRQIAKEQKEFQEAMARLTRNPDYLLYSNGLSRMIQYRADELMGPVASLDAAVKQEFVKGAMNGLILARDLPSITLAALNVEDPGT